MCVNYKAPRPSEIAMEYAATLPPDPVWMDDVWQDYAAPIIVRDSERRVLVGSYGMVPKRHIPGGLKKFTTMNARCETIGSLRSYATSWRDGQFCLVPCHAFYEPNWETGKHVRWKIGMADGSPFAVAGLWRTWNERNGTTTHAFTQITINADDHPLMRRFHKPGEEKRSLVILPREDWDNWMECRDPVIARSFLRPYPAELMTAEPAPKQTVSFSKPAALSPTDQARQNIASVVVQRIQGDFIHEDQMGQTLDLFKGVPKED